MTKYDNDYEPPAPIAKIALRNPETGERLKNISTLLDTGADISLPLSALKTLQIHPLEEQIKLVGFDNSIDFHEIYELQVIFLGKRFFGKYCAIGEDVGIIGRDILNQVSILFYGNKLEWEEIY